MDGLIKLVEDCEFAKRFSEKYDSKSEADAVILDIAANENYVFFIDDLTNAIPRLLKQKGTIRFLKSNYPAGIKPTHVDANEFNLVISSEESGDVMVYDSLGEELYEILPTLFGSVKNISICKNGDIAVAFGEEPPYSIHLYPPRRESISLPLEATAFASDHGIGYEKDKEYPLWGADGETVYNLQDPNGVRFKAVEEGEIITDIVLSQEHLFVPTRKKVGEKYHKNIKVFGIGESDLIHEYKLPDSEFKENNIAVAGKEVYSQIGPRNIIKLIIKHIS